MSKIFIASLKLGSGHLMAAQAIAEALARDHAAVEVKRVDFLDNAPVLPRILYGYTYNQIVPKWPELYGYFYNKYKSFEPLSRPRWPWSRLSTLSFFTELDDYNPDLVIATHFIAAGALVDYRARKKLNFPILFPTTDYEIHPLLKVSGVDYYCVQTDEMKSHLQSLGVPAARISITGIPVRLAFTQNKDKAALQEKYKLKPNEPTVLLMAGGFGLMPLDHVVADVLQSKQKFQLIIVCGRHHQFYESMLKLQATDERLKLVFEFIPFIDELMALADFMVAKPGGSIVSESLAMALPMLLVEPVPGQEDANVEYLLENGAAIKARHKESLMFKLSYLLDHPEKLQEMREAIKKIARADAARTVADLACEIIKQS